MKPDPVFAQVGFDKSLEAAFQKLRTIIESADGCDAKLYKPPRMRQARAAHVLPGADGKKKAQQVFAVINPGRNFMQIVRRRNGRIRNPTARWKFRVDSGFSDWETLKKSLKEWALDPKVPKKPKAGYDYGDGVALPGGLPETIMLNSSGANPGLRLHLLLLSRPYRNHFPEPH